MAHTADVSQPYDYVIVGAGSAGCVLANRLSADPAVRVCVIEAGGKDDWIWFHIPVGYLFAIGNPRADWCFKTEPEPGLNGRVLSYPRGKTIGGSSAINAMIYMRGQAADYDHWRQLGLEGWGWDDVLPLFKRHEDHFLGRGPHHEVGGEWHVEFPRIGWPLLDAVRRAAAEDGIAPIDDFNTGDNAGSCYFHVNQKRGLRWSSARGFLKPVLSRPNLDLVTAGHVERVCLEGRRATGVVVRAKDGTRRTLAARREVVLSAGAIGSPQLLMLSGIGPGDHLRALGIHMVHDAPGVGSNLQDHLQLRTVFQVSGIGTLNERYHSVFGKIGMGLDFAVRRRGPLTMAPSQLGLFTRSFPQKERADLEFHVQPLSLDKFGEPLHRFRAFTMSVCNLRPTSRGTLRLKSPEAAAAPAISPNYLSTEEDLRVAAQSIRVARRIVARPALAAFSPREVVPGLPADADEAALRHAAGDVGTTIFHPVGTAKMGLPSDSSAVVDARLKVMGIEGLRVADASVMPSIPSGNTNSPTIMIAEKAAALILADAR